MAWSHVATTSNGYAGADDEAVIGAPAGVQVGDLLVASIACETAGFGERVITAPAGWTEVRQRGVQVGANGPILALFYRIATAADVGGATYTFAWTHAATGRAASVTALRGVNRADPFEHTPSIVYDTADTTAPTDNLVPELATDLAFAAFVAHDGSSITWTPPAGFTELADVAGTASGAAYVSLASYYDPTALSGSASAIASVAYDVALAAIAAFHMNPPPDAPIITTRTNFDAAQAATFAWDFSDAMAGDVQTAYQLRIYRVSTGALVVDTGTVATAAEAHVLAGSTLTNGLQYQWQVRTRDVDSEWGAYSQLQSFYTSAPPVPAITSPAANGAVITTSSHTFTWTLGDPEAGPQSKYHVVLKRTDTNVTVLDTEEVSSADLSRVVSGLLNGVPYSLELTAWDDKGISSALVTRTFTVSYAQPPKPSVTIDDNDGEYLQAIIANPGPTGTEVVAASNDLYRREGATGDWIRIATGLAVNVVYNDYAVASGQDYQYKAVALTGAGGTLESDPTASYSVRLDGVWLHDPTDADDTSKEFRNRGQARTVSKKLDVSMMQFEGREYPVAEFGTAVSESVTFDELMFSDSDDLASYRALVESKRTLCYRDDRGRKVFGIISDINETDHPVGAEVPISITATDYSEEV